MIWMLGMPDEVYGSTARGNRPSGSSAVDKQLPVYDTDDTAAAILRYGAGSMATVVTTRSSGPVSEEINLHGQAGSLSCNSEWFLLRDPDGKVLDTARTEIGPTDLIRRQGEAFAQAIIDGKSRYECSGRENLLNLAAIEAIYLSDQTFQPENPLRLLKSRGLSVEDCLQHRPANQLYRPLNPSEGG
jgi:predicted dehydrogenase